MRLFSILAAAAVLSAPAAALAGDKAGAPKAKKVCEVIEPAVGRLPAKRICRTVPAPAPAEQAPQPQHEAHAAGGDAAPGNH